MWQSLRKFLQCPRTGRRYPMQCFLTKAEGFFERGRAAKGTQMPIYRVVSKTDAATPEQAAEFIRRDTGGQVNYDPTFPIIEEEDCFRIPAWSADGRAAMPLSVVRNLAILGKDESGNDLKERPYNESAGPHPSPDRLEELKAN